ncbi:MAG: hypothetical protein HQL22_01105 [Candidatus Omnitrophica bacterium]|nr:hypothetical protein [Candidatus Omnitrophota bacterium]
MAGGSPKNISSGSMTHDEIYDHLANVYLGKREKVEVKKKKSPSVWLAINIVITAIILTSVVYGFTAFLTRHDDLLKSRVIYALNNSPIRLTYNVGDGFPQAKELTIALPSVDAAKYSRLNLTVKAAGGGNPGMVKVVLSNTREEHAVYYLQGIKTRWQDYSISFDQLNLTDWKSLRDVSFVVEAWNAQKADGTVFIDNISFSN